MKTTKELPEDMILLIVSSETGQATKEEQAALDAYLARHPHMRERAEQYIDIIRNAGHLEKTRPIDKGKAWKALLEKSGKPGQSHMVGRKAAARWLKYAAALIPLLIGMGFLYFYLSGQDMREAREHAEVMSASRHANATLVLSSGESLVLDDHTTGQFFEDDGVKLHQDQSDRIRLAEASTSVMHSLLVPRGGEYQLVLSDGSSVWVNSDSQLDYPTLFDEDQRVIRLEGEAFFDVAPDPERPFIVETPDMSVVVKGTTFNIYNYVDDVAEATVVSGEIAVASGNQPAVEVFSGQQARLPHPEAKLTVSDVDVGLYTSWVEGMFRFRDMPLHELALRMERWYDVNIDFADEEVAELRLTGAMEKDRSVEYLVFLIEKSASLEIDVQDETIRIRRLDS